MEQIILSGITFDQLQDSIKGIVRNEVVEAFSSLPKVTEPPKLITRKETALILGISLPTLNEWTKTGIIPAKRISSRVRYERAEVYSSFIASAISQIQ